MSWLARSIATSLNIPEDSGADDDPDAVAAASPPSARTPPPPPPPPHSAAADGVKEDLTELSKTLTRQFWGVANFLAPPPGEVSPSPSPSPLSAEGQSTDAETPPEITGIRSDFSEIRGRFRSGISRISSHKAVSGFSSIASNFFAPEDEEEEDLPEAVNNEREDGARLNKEENEDEVRRDVEKMERLGVADDEVRHEWEEQRVRHKADDGEVWHGEHGEVDDSELERARVVQEDEVEEEWDVIGITDEVLTFATNIARHPETWLDFPLLPDEEESDGPFSYFDMSNAQEEHALAIGHLAPTLAALRIELCPIHMSEECFWKIYFVLLHPRLNKHDAELLSTPQNCWYMFYLNQDPSPDPA